MSVWKLRSSKTMVCAMGSFLLACVACGGDTKPAKPLATDIFLEAEQLRRLLEPEVPISRETVHYFTRISQDEAAAQRAAVVLVRLFCYGDFANEDQKVAVLKVCRILGLGRFRKCYEEAREKIVIYMPHPYQGYVTCWDVESVMTAMCAGWSDDALLQVYVMNLETLGQMRAIHLVSYFGNKGMSLLLDRFPQMNERGKELALDVLAWNGKEAFADEIAAIMLDEKETLYTRLGAAEALAESGKPERVCSFLRKYPPEESNYLVAANLAAYGTLADVKNLLESNKSVVKQFGLHGLRRFALKGDRDVIEILLQTLSARGPDQLKLKRAAIQSLPISTVRMPSVSRRLKDHLRHEDLIYIRSLIGEVFLDAGMDAGVQILRQVCKEAKPDSSEYWLAKRELAEWGDKAALIELVKAGRIMLSEHLRDVIVPKEIAHDQQLSRKWIRENASFLRWDVIQNAFVERRTD